MDEDLDEDLQRDHTLSLVLERLEKLAAQHSALITAHSELMAQHESVLKRLESYSFLPMDASNRDQYRASSPRTAPPPLQKPVSSHQSRASAIGKHGASSSSSAPSSSLSSSSTTPTVARILGEHRESSRSSMSEPRQQTRRPSMSTPRGRKVRSKEQAFSPLNQSLRHSDQRRGASIGRTTQTRGKVERSLVLKRPTSITAAKGNNLGGTEAATVTSTTFSSTSSTEASASPPIHGFLRVVVRKRPLKRTCLERNGILGGYGDGSAPQAASNQSLLSHGGASVPLQEDCVDCRSQDDNCDENGATLGFGHVLCVEKKVKVDLTPFTQQHSFFFDDAFDEDHSNESIFARAVKPLVDNFFARGGSSTCFCFGPTASGKTFTLFGAAGGKLQPRFTGTTVGHHQDEALEQEVAGDKYSSSDGDPSSTTWGETPGLYKLAAEEIFERFALQEEQQRLKEPLHLTISMFEIYGQKVRDLLSDSCEVQALEDGDGVLQLKGLRAEVCTDLADFMRWSAIGRNARSTTATNANATSSRSHAALQLRLVRGEGEADSFPANSTSGGKSDDQNLVLGKLSLIDLAGSERGVDNEETDKVTRKEGRDINTSLLALKEV